MQTNVCILSIPVQIYMEKVTKQVYNSCLSEAKTVLQSRVDSGFFYLLSMLSKKRTCRWAGLLSI